MFFRILKKDLKRKKTMNTVLLLFIILAAMFVASGLENVITVLNGTDYYLDKAGVGDYVILTMGDNGVGGMEKVLKQEDCVKSYKIEPVVFGAQNNVLLDDGTGREAEMRNTVLFQSIADSKLSFFDSENQVIEDVKPGHVYVSGKVLENNHLEKGDKILIRLEGVELELVLEGKAKDAFLGSDFMGNQRLLLNDGDMQKLLADEQIMLHYRGEIGYIETEDASALASAVSKIEGVGFDGARSTIKMCYVMDMIVAFIVLILSICLVIVAFVVLNFSIGFTIMEEFREIGVMKAIGITNRKIRSLYIGKYLLLSLAGAAIGFFASIPFGTMLLKSVSENMLLGNDMGLVVNLAGAFIVVVLILLFAYRCTGKVKKATPIDAIRSGQTGERYKKKTIYRIGKSHLGTNLYMAVNDVLSSPKRFLSIIISFFICTLFVLMVVNTTATMESPNLVETFGTRSDLYITETGEAMQHMLLDSKEAYQEYLDERAAELTEKGMPATMCVEVQYKYRVSFEGKDYTLTCQQGIGTKAEDYVYAEGSPPQNKHEVAITSQISDMIGAKIGDTITVDFGEEKLDCIVTAYFQSMNQLGELVRLHEDAPVSFGGVAGILHTQINFTDEPDDAVIQERKEKIRELYDNEEVMDAKEYCVECIGVVDTMKGVQYLLLAITLVVVLLVTILMEYSFIADERSQIAILKAIGFRNRDVVRWHTYRFGFVSLISVILAALASIPMTKLCISPIFGMMGASDVDYNIDPVQIFFLYPGIVFAATVLVAGLCALRTRQVHSRDTANIE